MPLLNEFYPQLLLLLILFAEFLDTMKEHGIQNPMNKAVLNEMLSERMLYSYLVNDF